MCGYWERRMGFRICMARAGQSADGGVGTSRGDVIDAAFHPPAQGSTDADGGAGHGGASGKAASRKAATRKSGAQKKIATKPAAGQGAENEVVSAVQQGHVVMTNLPAKKPGAAKQPEPGQGTANRAEYDGVLDQLTLVGNAALSSAGSEVWAGRVVVDLATNDAEAQGAVKTSLVQSEATSAKSAAAKTGGEDGMVHVVSDRAVLHRETEVAEFYGSAGRPARLWQQDGSSVEAPVLVFEREQKVLTAHGDGQQAAPVHSVFVNEGGASAAKSGKNKPGVVRVSSRELRYSDVEREGVFSGGVELENGEGSMTAQRAEVFLQPAGVTSGANASGANAAEAKAAAGAKPEAGMLGGSVERVVMTGAVHIEQPGRHGTGEKLVYTASDGKSVLTGTAAAPPKMVDDQRGTETGTSLTFHSGDNNVEVTGAPPSAGSNGQRVHTQTRVKNKEK